MNLNEVADVLEVIEAMCVNEGWEMTDALALKAKKKEARGGFEMRIVLEESGD